MPETRETERGPLWGSYVKARSALAGLVARGKEEVRGLSGSKPADDPLTSGHDWKGKTPEEVDEADEVRSQEEMKETFGGDGARQEEVRKGDALASGDGAAVYERTVEGAAPERDARVAPHKADEADLSGEVDDGGPRGDVELSPKGGAIELQPEDDPNAHGMSLLDQRAMRDLANASEDEDGRVPSDGLGLDDTGDPTFASDLNR